MINWQNQQGSLNYQFRGDQTIQMYGSFEGFPLQQCIVWVGNIMTPDQTNQPAKHVQ